MPASARRSLIVPVSTLVLTLLSALPMADGQAGPRSEKDRQWATFDPQGLFDAALKGRDGATLFQPTLAYLGSAPVNDLCGNATVIPGSTVSYQANQNTAAATNDLCSAPDSCEGGGVGTSNSVWFRYTPDRDGSIRVSTSGSNYNTVLSVHDGCGFLSAGFQCVFPDELACNDDYFFGTTSQVFLDVVAGETYLIKVSDYDINPGGGQMQLTLDWYPANDHCTGATPVVGIAFEELGLPTQNATIEPCEAQESCEFNGVGVSNSVWYSFIAPCDGFVSANTNGSSYDTVLSLWDGCGEFTGVDNPCIVPNEIACDDDGGTGTKSQIVSAPVQAGVEYFIKVADYNTSQGGGFLDFHFVFEGANPPVAQITSPGDFDCVAGPTLLVTGSATAGTGGLADWTLESRPVSSQGWTEIASGSDAVSNGSLGTWNLSGLPNGYYTLRLTVANSCGQANTDVALVLIDTQFDVLDWFSPADEAVLGGTACLTGTITDACLEAYTIEVRPSGGSFTAIGDYGQPINFGNLMQLGGWDTTTVADGSYDLRITARDGAGNDASETRTVIVDNTLPTALLTSPTYCPNTKGLIAITGVADDANLQLWDLSYTGGGNGGWVSIAQGSEPVPGGPLGALDLGALPPCGYTIRLRVWDRASVDCGHARFVDDYVSVSNVDPVLTRELELAQEHP